MCVGVFVCGCVVWVCVHVCINHLDRNDLKKRNKRTENTSFRPAWPSTSVKNTFKHPTTHTHTHTHTQAQIYMHALSLHLAVVPVWLFTPTGIADVLHT